MLDNEIWPRIASYFKSKLDTLFDPAAVLVDDPLVDHDHKGFYVGVVDSLGKGILREGFMQEGLTNLRTSVDTVANALFSQAKDKNVSRDKLQSSTLYFYCVQNCTYIADPLAWDENVDGIYFMWGQKYRGLYLPYEIKQFGLTKTETLDRLCSQEVHVPSTLWRLPEGLCWKISCIEYIS